MIEKHEVQNLAELARIKMNDEELASFTKDFEEILAYVSSLQKLNIDTINEESLRAIYPTNTFREDENSHESNAFTEKILKEAPKTHKGFIQVDKILNQE